ncbi:MAG: hypothetical protein IKT17_01625 [Lachnospiraceae bacterium]|nr:hypothetical protein [Lachnospiraceae bacterium]
MISILFIYAFSLWISPLYKHWYGCDASFFTLVGRGMLEGKVPYKDFYDLKGPYFFFIQALGQLIKRGHNGLFVLEIIALFASLVLIYKTGRLYISYKKTLAVIAFFLWPYVTMLWGGNCLEEFMLPLNMLVLYLTMKYYGSGYNTTDAGDVSTAVKDDTDDKGNIVATITGLCFTITAFSKITAGAPIAGLILGVMILHLYRREYRKLLFYILYLILGAVIGLIPLLIYYGINGCILKMLYCTFIFGFKRSSDLSGAFSWSTEARLSGVTFAIVFFVTHEKKYRALLLPMCVITYLVLHLGDSFIYYFITGMPCLIAALILFLKNYDPLILFKNLKQSLCFLFLFIFVFNYTHESMGTVKTFLNREDDSFQEQYYRDSVNMAALIPPFDRNSVFSFDIDMQWYEINNIMPCNRYMVNLQYFIALEPPIEQELFDFFENTPPKWMICSNTLGDYLPQMNEIVNEKYDCLYSTDVGLVYLLRD